MTCKHYEFKADNKKSILSHILYSINLNDTNCLNNVLFLESYCFFFIILINNYCRRGQRCWCSGGCWLGIQISWLIPALHLIFFQFGIIQGLVCRIQHQRYSRWTEFLCNFLIRGGLQSFNLERSGSVALKPKLPAKEHVTTAHNNWVTLSCRLSIVRVVTMLFGRQFCFSATLPERSKLKLCNPPTNQKNCRELRSPGVSLCCIRQPVPWIIPIEKNPRCSGGIEPTISVSKPHSHNTTPLALLQ